MCKAKSDGGHRCDGCIRKGIMDRLTGAAEASLTAESPAGGLVAA